VRIAVSLFLVHLLVTVACFFLAVLNRGTDLPPGPSSVLSDVVQLLAFLPFAVVGAMIISRLPRNRIGWIFLITALGMAISLTAFEYAVYALLTNPGSLPGGDWGVRVSQWTFGLPFLAYIFLFLLFPTGSLPSRRWLPVGALTVLGVAVLVASEFTEAVPFEVARVLVIIAECAAAAGAVVRYRGSNSEERQQIKWFTFAAVPAVAVLIGPLFFNPSGLYLPVAFLATVGVASGAWIAISKYRLYEIDVILNKTIVYGFLAALISLIYVLVVVVLGAMIGATEGLSLVAAAVAAVAVQPARERAQRFANRVVYGERATPYEVLSTFSRHLGEIYSTDDVLPRMAQILAEGTGASAAVVWLRIGPQLRPAASWPANGPLPAPVAIAGESLPRLTTLSRVEATTRDAPVRHQGELLGAFSVTKPPYEPLTPVESELLGDLAGQAGLVLRNAALIADLRDSRKRLVAAQDEERRRIERNLHDGAQQQLVALAVKVRLATSMIGKDEDAERRLLDEVQSDTGDALENLRDLARGIYPPLLADQGLRAALLAQTRKAAIPTTLEADGVGRYPREAEAAVYFCCLEALQNVAKYAGASRAVIRLIAEEDHLRFEVADDGAGFDPRATGYGTGLQGMADRLEAIGGTLQLRSAPAEGTTVIGRLPT
jgi:signal transduction histidine kinase